MTNVCCHTKEILILRWSTFLDTYISQLKLAKKNKRNTSFSAFSPFILYSEFSPKILLFQRFPSIKSPNTNYVFLLFESVVVFVMFRKLSLCQLYSAETWLSKFGGRVYFVFYKRLLFESLSNVLYFKLANLHLDSMLIDIDQPG